MSAKSLTIRRCDQLTPRQCRFLALLSGGATLKEIAFEMGVEPKTAEYFFATVKTSTGLDSKQELTKLALRIGLTEIDV